MNAEGVARVSVADMSPDHIDAVMEIDAVAYPGPWTRAVWERELTDPGRTHVVALADGVLVGHAGTMRVLDEIHITTVAVTPDRRGEGIASELLLNLLDSAVAAGIVSATLEVRAANRDVQRLYSRFGFVPAGVRRGYYSNPADDAIIMWLTDAGSDQSQQRLDHIRTQLVMSVGQR